MQVSSLLLGGGHGPHIVIPDYKIYTVGEHTPKLLEVQQKLAAKGLKDPWLRNEVWRYDVREMIVPSVYQRAIRLLFRGFVPGLFLASLSALAYYEWDKKLVASKGGHHGHH